MYKVHETPHVNRPGAYAESYHDIHKESWTGKLVGGFLALAVLLVLGYLLVNQRTPSYEGTGFAEVLAAAKTPADKVGFFQKLTPKFSDGEHFRVDLLGNSLLQKGTGSVVLREGSANAYLIRSENIGSIVAEFLQSSQKELRFDTSQAPSGPILVEGVDGVYRPAMIYRLGIASEPAAEIDGRIKYDKERTFEVGKKYAFTGGVEMKENRVVLFRLPEADPPYKVELAVTDPSLRQLLRTVAENRYRVTAYATLASMYPWSEGTGKDKRPGLRQAERIIGRTGPEIIFGFSGNFYQAPGG